MYVNVTNSQIKLSRHRTSPFVDWSERHVNAIFTLADVIVDFCSYFGYATINQVHIKDHTTSYPLFCAN